MAKHVFRVASQREKRRKNPPKKNRPSIVCKTCDRTFSCRFQLKEHEKGEKHKKALERQKIAEEGLKCALCDLKFDRVSNYESHLGGRRHLAAKRRRDLPI